jgi:NAD(P)-dependent dehydrogenase (short-subunit alcohol dehydrogenase family)
MKTMVITGASTGVGRAAALHFAKEGYAVCALARSVDKLQRLEAEGGGNIVSYPTDVSDSGQVAHAFDQILARHGAIDVLINNAGIVPEVQPVDFAMIDRVIDTNLKGAMYCTYAALPSMQQAGKGRIINVASIAGVNIRDKGNNGLYTASKHGMVGFSDAIGKLVRRQGILVTALCPGGIDTPLWNEDHPYAHDKEMMIRPQEVVDLMAFILAQPDRTVFKNVIFVPVSEDG